MTDPAGGQVAGQGARPPSLAEKVAHLRQPASYPDPTDRVEAIETHMSWVFLTERHAYKLKKPVRHSFLDFSTLALRRADCEEEVRLNRRLAPGVYLGVVPLVVDARGALALSGPGEPAEWLVQMVRLPRERMLDAVMAAGEVDDRHIVRLAEVLARFYRGCSPVAMSPGAYLTRLGDEIATCARELGQAGTGLARPTVERTASCLAGFIERHLDLLAARLRDGRIVEGHGDLRPEHVCLLADPVVIDCLEFNRELRVLDVADELGYLEMECARLGSPGVGRALFEGVARALDDEVPPALKTFYCGCRAFTRARIAAWHNVDAPAPDPSKWIRRAGEYLALAEAYARGCCPPGG